MSIDFDDFLKVDMRAGRVIAVEDFDRAKKPSYRIQVDFGPEVGTKWSSVQARAEYTKDKLIDAIVIGVVNLPPRNIAGFMSEFLTVGVPAEDGSLSLLMPTRGAKVGGRVY